MLQPGYAQHLPRLLALRLPTPDHLPPIVTPRRAAALKHRGRIVPNPLRQGVVKIGAGQADVGQRTVVKLSKHRQALAMLPAGHYAGRALLQLEHEIENSVSGGCRHGSLHRSKGRSSWSAPANAATRSAHPICPMCVYAATAQI